ncbi:transcription antitermination factor NusB [Candidatus Dependentiae bacterium]|nr:transcription antitermination factor NusB [Candidatus Dependentiae bacterium]
MKDKQIIKSMRDIRALAFHFLYVAEAFDYVISMDEIVEMFRTGFNIEIDDDSKAAIIAFNVIDQREELDKNIEPLLKNWKLNRLGCCTRLILRMSIWELLKKETPPSIIINEAIELAKCFAEKDSYKFINGILDEICKKFNLCLEKKDIIKDQPCED